MSKDFAVIEEESKIDIEDAENEQIDIEEEEENEQKVEEEGEEGKESKDEDKETEENTLEEENNSEYVTEYNTKDICEEMIEEGCAIQIIDIVDDDDNEDKINFFQLLKEDDEKTKV